MAEYFGQMPDGQPVFRCIIEGDGLKVAVLTFGAVLQSIEVFDGRGSAVNVVLGLTNLHDYEARSPHFGAVPGRFAGRIAGGRFSLGDRQYQLTQNNGQNSIHGGRRGFGKTNWTLDGYSRNQAALRLISPDGDEGYPGQLTTEVRYSIQGSSLRADYRAQTTRTTILNLTNHSYFNLGGEGSGSALDHELTMINTNVYFPTDQHSIPTGERRLVRGTPFDFTSPQVLGTRIRDSDPQMLIARGYDHTFLVNGTGLRPAARLFHPVSGRQLTVSTTEPALQLYTANTLTGALVGPSGRAYRQGDAVCLEAQHVPDSPNHPNFPSTTLVPGETYAATTIFTFSTIDD